MVFLSLDVVGRVTANVLVIFHHGKEVQCLLGAEFMGNMGLLYKLYNQMYSVGSWPCRIYVHTTVCTVHF